MNTNKMNCERCQTKLVVHNQWFFICPSCRLAVERPDHPPYETKEQYLERTKGK